MYYILLAIFLFAISSYAEAIEPTKLRIWNSKSGNKIAAKASEMTQNGSIQLITKDGRELTLGIDEFSEEDQAFLEKHFKKKKIQFAANAGTLGGPIQADAKTSYFVYTPKNLESGTRAPVMIWTQSDGAKQETLQRFTEAADVLGMVIASPIEARHEGQVTLLNNFGHTRNVLSDVKRDYNISSHGIHFGGDKSGGAAALYNSLKIRSAGTYTVSGYLTPSMTGANQGHHFMAGSTNSSHRYMTAYAAAKFEEDATHKLYFGAREMPDSRDITIGMIWMYAQGLYENASTRGDEIETFEKRVLPWLKDLMSASIGQAAYLTHMLNSDCRLKGRFKQEIEKIHTQLLQSKEAVAYIQGTDALDDFSETQLARYGSHFKPLTEHKPKKFERMMARLEKTYEKAQDLEPVLKALAKPTHR
ncbi:hypothetical protein N8660_02380 [Akkermansiaceae bacterium]|nr:hypothetical protein [Akkermansiaceae bacterium]